MPKPTAYMLTASSARAHKDCYYPLREWLGTAEVDCANLGISIFLYSRALQLFIRVQNFWERVFERFLTGSLKGFTTLSRYIQFYVHLKQDKFLIYEQRVCGKQDRQRLAYYEVCCEKAQEKGKILEENAQTAQEEEAH